MWAHPERLSLPSATSQGAKNSRVSLQPAAASLPSTAPAGAAHGPHRPPQRGRVAGGWGGGHKRSRVPTWSPQPARDSAARSPEEPGLGRRWPSRLGGVFLSPGSSRRQGSVPRSVLGRLRAQRGRSARTQTRRDPLFQGISRESESHSRTRLCARSAPQESRGAETCAQGREGRRERGSGDLRPPGLEGNRVRVAGARSPRREEGCPGQGGGRALGRGAPGSSAGAHL